MLKNKTLATRCFPYDMKRVRSYSEIVIIHCSYDSSICNFIEAATDVALITPVLCPRLCLKLVLYPSLDIQFLNINKRFFGRTVIKSTIKSLLCHIKKSLPAFVCCSSVRNLLYVAFVRIRFYTQYSRPTQKLYIRIDIFLFSFFCLKFFW